MVFSVFKNFSLEQFSKTGSKQACSLCQGCCSNLKLGVQFALIKNETDMCLCGHV